MTCFLIHLLISLVCCAFLFFISSGERGFAIIGTLQRIKGNKFDVKYQRCTFAAFSAHEHVRRTYSQLGLAVNMFENAFASGRSPVNAFANAFTTTQHPMNMFANVKTRSQNK